jgi:hypothetical protein
MRNHYGAMGRTSLKPRVESHKKDMSLKDSLKAIRDREKLIEIDGYHVNGTCCRVQIISRAFGENHLYNIVVCINIQKNHYADGLGFSLSPRGSVHGSVLACREPGRVLESPKFQVFLMAMLRLISKSLERWKRMIVALGFS